MEQMSSDGPHSFSDLLGTLIDIISRKKNTESIHNAEQNFGRFMESWVGNRPTTGGMKLPSAPWLLSPDSLKCDNRAAVIKYHPGYQTKAGPIFYMVNAHGEQ